MADDGINWTDGSSMAAIGIKFGFTPDKKSENAMKQSFSGLTSLVHDLAHIGQIAGDALSKIWDLGAKSIQIGVEEGKGGAMAAAQGVSAAESRRLRDAMESAGGQGEDADKIIAELHRFSQAFQNPSKDFAEKYIVKMNEVLSREGVNEGLKQDIIGALEDGDQMGALQHLTTVIDNLGDGAFTAMNSLGLGSLGVLSNDDSMDLFREKMNESISLYESNNRSLLEVGSSLSTIKESFNHLARDLTVMLEGPMAAFADWFKIFVQMEPQDWMGMIWDAIYKNLIPSDSLLGMRRDQKSGAATSRGDELMKGILNTIPSGILEGGKRSEWLTEFNAYAGTAYKNIEALKQDVNTSGNLVGGTFDDDEKWVEKLEMVDRSKYLFEGYFPASTQNYDIYEAWGDQ